MKEITRVELRCPLELALRLGAIVPESPQHHRKLMAQGSHMLVRDTATGYPLFWLWMGAPPRLIEIMP